MKSVKKDINKFLDMSGKAPTVLVKVHIGMVEVDAVSVEGLMVSVDVPSVSVEDALSPWCL